MLRTVVKTKEERCRVLVELNEQRLKGKLCDTTIISEGQEFPAHLCVLVTTSGYFEGLCEQRAIAQDNAQLVCLPERIGASTVEQVLSYIYLGQVEISHVTVIDLLYAADFLLITELKSLCHRFLSKTLSCHNCVEYLKIAYMFQLKPVFWSARKVIKSRLLDHIIHTDDLWHLADPSELQVMLKDETVKEVITPPILFNIIKGWIQFNTPNRYHLFPILFEDCINPILPTLSADYLKQLLNDSFVINHSSCFNKLEAAYDCISTTNSVCEDLSSECDSPPNKRLRNQDDCSLKESFSDFNPSGSKSPKNHDNRSAICSPSTMCDKSTSPPTNSFNEMENSIPVHSAQAGLSSDVEKEILDVIVVNGLGNKKNFAYVVCEDRWVCLPDLPEKRTNHGMTQYGNKLYLVGGLQDAYVIGEDYLDLTTGTWASIAPTNHPHLNVQSVLVHHDDLFVIDSVGKVERYFSSTNTWTSVYPFQQKRTNAVVTTASHNSYDLYMCYASEAEDPNGFGVPTRFQVYLYDEDLWKELSPPRLDDGSFWKLQQYDQLFSKGDFLFLLNAICGVAVRYEPKTKQWCSAPDVAVPPCPQDILPKNNFTSVTWPGASFILDVSPRVTDATVMYGTGGAVGYKEQAWLWKCPPPFSLVVSYLVRPSYCHAQMSKEALAKCPHAKYCQN